MKTQTSRSSLIIKFFLLVFPTLLSSCGFYFFTENEPPEVVIEYPKDGEILPQKSYYYFVIDAEDHRDQIVEVKISIDDGEPIYLSNTGLHKYSKRIDLSQYSLGVHKVVATAKDSDGERSRSTTYFTIDKLGSIYNYGLDLKNCYTFKENANLYTTISSYAKTINHTENKLYFTSFNNNGEVVKEDSIISPDKRVDPCKIFPMSNGNSVILSTNHYSTGSSAISISSLSDSWSTIDEKLYFDGSSPELNDCIRTSDNHLLITGTHFGSNGVEDLLIKTDIYGDSLWCRSFDLPYSQVVVEDSDGNYLYIGKSSPHDQGFTLNRISDNGELISTHTYSIYTSQIDPKSAIIDSDGAIVIAGDDFHYNNSNIFILKTYLDRSYTFVSTGWIFNETASSIVEDGDGYKIVGKSDMDGDDTHNLILYDFDKELIKFDIIDYGGDRDEYGVDIFKIDNRNYIIGGSSKSYSSSSNSCIWFLGVNEECDPQF